MFLTQLLAEDPKGVADVVDAARHNLSQTRPAKEAFLDALERQQQVDFVLNDQPRLGPKRIAGSDPAMPIGGGPF
jgi:hypothetical protein